MSLVLIEVGLPDECTKGIGLYLNL